MRRLISGNDAMAYLVPTQSAVIRTVGVGTQRAV